MTPLPEPNACFWCDDPQPHGWQWVPGPGLHQWTPPTDRMRLDRMKARRRHRLIRKAARR